MTAHRERRRKGSVQVRVDVSREQIAALERLGLFDPDAGASAHCGVIRAVLVRSGLDRSLFAAITRQLEVKGVAVRTGTLVDAKLTSSACIRRGSDARGAGHRRRKRRPWLYKAAGTRLRLSRFEIGEESIP